MNCNICNSKDLLSSCNPEYKKCKNCSTEIFVPSSDLKVTDYYDEVNHLPEFNKQRKLFTEYLSFADDVLMRRHANVIEIGSGDDTFISLITEKFGKKTKIYSCEESEVSKNLLKKKGILLIDYNDIGRLKNKIIFLFQVIEHIENPVEFLNGLGTEPGDTIILTTPLVGSRPHLKAKGSWKSYSPYHHLNLFSMQSFQTLAATLSFTIIKYKFVCSGNSYCSYFKCIWQYGLSVLRFFYRILTFKKLLKPCFYYNNSILLILQKK